MARELSVDEVLAELRRLSATLAGLREDDPRRVALDRRREELRRTARDAADRARHPDSLRRELELLRDRLAALEALPIEPSWPERTPAPWINDPSAYARDINRRIAEQTAGERRWLAARIARLETLLQSRNDPNA